MKKVFKKLTAAVLATGLLFSLAACGKKEEGSTAAEEKRDVKKIVFAYRNTGNWPVTGEDESGNPSGYDIEVLREVDALLEDYEFEYVGTSYDDAYIGLEAGNYDAALTNAFWTEARAEKYLIPEQNLGASVLVLVKTKDHPEIKDLHDLHDSGLKLAPLLAGNGMYYVVKQYNEENPDAQVNIDPTDDSTYVAGSIEELVAGKYDAVIETKPSFESKVTAEDGDWHNLLDKISSSEFTLAKTYPMFSKSVGQDFVNEFSEALKQVVDSGKASEISDTFFGYDLWNYDFQ